MHRTNVTVSTSQWGQRAHVYVMHIDTHTYTYTNTHIQAQNKCHSQHISVRATRIRICKCIQPMIRIHIHNHIYTQAQNKYHSQHISVRVTWPLVKVRQKKMLSTLKCSRYWSERLRCLERKCGRKMLLCRRGESDILNTCVCVCQSMWACLYELDLCVVLEREVAMLREEVRQKDVALQERWVWICVYVCVCVCVCACVRACVCQRVCGFGAKGCDA